MSRSWNIFLIVLSTTMMSVLGWIAYTEPDENLEIAREIYAEKLSISRERPKRAQDFIPKEIQELPKRLREAQNKGSHAFDAEVSHAYFKLIRANKTLCESVILEVMDILIENERSFMLLQFLQMTNESEDRILRTFACVKNPKLMSFFSINLSRELSKTMKSWQLSRAISRMNYDFTQNDPKQIDLNFRYVTIYGRGKVRTPETSYPIVSFIAKYRGFENTYKLYKEKSISDEQLEKVSRSIFDYAQFAIKIFALADEPDIALDLLDKLPETPNKNLVIKRVIRYILSSKGGIEAVKKHDIKNLLEN